MQDDIINTNEICIRPTFKPNDGYTGQSRVYINGYQTECIIKGTFLDQAFKTIDYYILFSSYDRDETYSLIISLVTQKGLLLETVTIFPYPPNLIIDCWGDPSNYVSHFTLVQPNIIIFRFLTDDLWKMEVFQKPKSLLKTLLFGNFDGANCNELGRTAWSYKTYLRFNKISDLAYNKKHCLKAIKTSISNLLN
ncbi:hypothetical protein [Commensalibacter papalotli (ex Botero et al. 2024)]|uniref:Uncharacterized protein n=1 Tax=Commensalibacter papalotli (ex Botero et al. 2024) TaxID=2972766 RepID=A0ABM9HNV7_9PROT|nr:hypothetical protein [Commensalibacter papalotli (ex Botero et al. 2024)]CAI3935701.1 unnamed protein product [Commensalibacter papalotli (ex Botero et al. 2024)]CAI3939997.1 unnamed protein product [Commensalibacter papalotli (ex Botero et al. 2024)]